MIQNSGVPYDLILRNAQILTSEGISEGDIAIENGQIAAVGDIPGTTLTEKDLAGKVVMAGGIDTQVHFREPGLTHKEDIESGSRAALHGGITTFLEMPNTKPETTSPEALADKLARANGRSWAHYGFFVGATPQNAEQLGEYELLPGTPGIKVFMGSSTGDLLVDKDEDIERVLRHGVGPVAFHAEDEARNVERKKLLSENPTAHEHHYLRDAESAVIATKRLIHLSEKTGRHVHILHISTADELPLIAEAKRKGLKLTCEVTPQHLWFAAPEAYDRWGTKAQMNPPIRSHEHRDGLWKALDQGLFDVFGSDHAPHTIDEKAQPYPKSPSGMPGVETILHVLLTFAAQGRIRYEMIAKMLCERPADLYRMKGKGYLQPGYDADLVVFDPKTEWVVDESNLQSKCGWSPYHGEEFIGKVEQVYLCGELAMSGGERVGPAKGQMIQFRA